jgi:glutathionylspermidine synthase
VRRRTREVRPDWREKVLEQGLTYAVTADDTGAPYDYWDESAYYEFTSREIADLEETVENLYDMALQAAAFVVAENRLADFGITTPYVAKLVTDSWHRRESEPSVYGRFDLRYDGDGPAKMLEYNGDTPTTLVEAASPQWFWMEELYPDLDQWNSLHERLVDAWRKQRPLLGSGHVHFSYSEADTVGEDAMTALYMAECASQAGLTTTTLAIEDVGWDPTGRFVDLDNRTIESMFKLYPWEWLATDKFGAHVRRARWIEPAWKMLLSNKALLAVMWELFPGHPNLLPAYLDGPFALAATGYVRKPLFGREGSGVEIVTPGFTTKVEALEGAWVYGDEGYCYQAFHALPDFDGNRPVLGAWMVDGESAGLGIRETKTLITDINSRFLPHVIVE